MGEAAKKDSSMEDILASIRRIITADTTEIKPEVRTEPAPAQQTLRPADVQRSILHNDIQLPRTGSFSALAQQVRAERNAPSAAPASEAPTIAPTVNVVPEAIAGRNILTAPKPTSLAKLGEQFKSAEAMASVLFEREYDKVETPALSVRVEKNVPERAQKIDYVNTDTVTPEETRADLKKSSSSHGLSLKELAEKVALAAVPPKAAEIPVAAPSGFASAIGAAAESEAMRDEQELPDETLRQPAAEKSSVQAEHITRAVSAFREALVSPSTQAAVTNSMDRLRHSVEDLDVAHVENILRPMLKAWLDDNLPNMVERMVQEEISRITTKK